MYTCGACKNKHTTREEGARCYALKYGQSAATVTPPEPADTDDQLDPNRMQSATKIPLEMLANTPDGYYAVSRDDTEALTFFRISRPTKGVWAGTIKIQSQHSDKLNFVMAWRPTSGWVRVYDPVREPKVLYVVVDPLGAQQRYAQEIGRCCNCGKTLTDQRSRYYGIGPDCEKLRPDVIEYVDKQNAEKKVV